MMRLLLRLTVLLLALGDAVLVAAPSGLPAPEQVFGFKPGTDYKLADYGQMVDYYRRLDAASDRIKVFEIGPTVEGRQMILAVISSEENMASLDRYRDISAKLAQARIDESQARELARIGKAVVWIDGGLHATEVGHAQHSPELAYRLITEETQSMRFIRDNVILLQVPVMNPDGLDLVVNWYRKNLGTKYETSPLPELYHKYAGHDNNRDWYMMTQPETRNASVLLYQKWYPQIVLNHHQTPPFPARIFLPPFTSPVNPNIPPLVMRGIDMVGNVMAARFEEEGKSGVVSRMEFDTWWNGGMRTTPCFHNMVGLLAETALYNYATPYYYKADSLPSRFKNGLSASEPSPDYPNPWKGGSWRLSDAVDYMLTASLGVLDVAARYRDQWLWNIYHLGRSAIEQGREGGPAAYVIPLQQHDPSAAVWMLDVLRLGGIEIEQADEAFQAGNEQFAKGTFIIRTDQAFRPYLVDLMEAQKYPEKQVPAEETQSYDMMGWTLPMQMGVRIVKAEKTLAVKSHPVDEPNLPKVAPVHPHALFGIDRNWNTSYTLVNRLLAKGIPVSVSPEEVRTATRTLPAGSFLVEGTHAAALQTLATEMRIPVYGLDSQPGPSVHRLVRPRVALYKSWTANGDEGWIRWLLERFEFAYESVHDDAIRQGRLIDRFDVIVLPSDSARRLVQGPPPGVMPPAFSTGIGQDGLDNLKQFVQEGGVLIASGATCEATLESFGLPVRNPLDELPDSAFSCPGSLVRLEVDRNDPIGWGMAGEVAACFVRSEAFDILENDSETTSIARYADDRVLMSGWMRGEKQLRGKAAVVRAKLGRGEVILLGFPPHFRGQSHGTFKLLFNSVYLAAWEKKNEEMVTTSGGD